MPDILFIFMCYFVQKFPFFLHYLFTLQCQGAFRVDVDAVGIAVTSHKTQKIQKSADLHKIFIAVRNTFLSANIPRMCVWKVLFAFFAQPP